jgi:hypothetical protein
MSTAFTQFLREQAEKHEAEARAGKATVDEWRAAIERLFTQIRAWLADSDPEGIIEIKQGQHDASEPGLGRYRVPRLDLNAFGKWIGIIPKARNTVASARPPQRSAPERATGRVDITDEVRRYVLYRFPQNGGSDVWLIDDPNSNTDPKLLDQQAFETALMSYLR